MAKKKELEENPPLEENKPQDSDELAQMRQAVERELRLRENIDRKGLGRLQRLEIAAYRVLYLNPVLENPKKLEPKDAKVIIDSIRYAQDCERRAWEFENKDTGAAFEAEDIVLETCE